MNVRHGVRSNCQITTSRLKSTRTAKSSLLCERHVPAQVEPIILFRALGEISHGLLQRHGDALPAELLRDETCSWIFFFKRGT